MAYTSAEQTELDRLQAAYNKALSDYTYAKSMNETGHAYQAVGNYTFPYSGQHTDEASFYAWLAQSDAGLANTSATYQAAKTQLDAYRQYLHDKYIVNNVEAQTQIVQSQINAQAEVLKNQDNKRFMQGTTKYLIVAGIVLMVIVASVIIYRRKFKAA
jgi:hypothetical protein